MLKGNCSESASCIFTICNDDRELYWHWFMFHNCQKGDRDPFQCLSVMMIQSSKDICLYVITLCNDDRQRLIYHYCINQWWASVQIAFHLSLLSVMMIDSCTLLSLIITGKCTESGWCIMIMENNRGSVSWCLMMIRSCRDSGRCVNVVCNDDREPSNGSCIIVFPIDDGKL